MAARTGIDAQWGFAAESTYGTGVTVDTFLPLVSEGMKRNEAFTESEGIIAGRRHLTSDQWNSGDLDISGPVQTELHEHDVHVLLEHCLGGSSGSGPWTITPATLSDLGLTMQFGVPGVGGTVHPFTYAGCKIASWELACAAGQVATLGLDVVAQTVTTGTALASASYTSGNKPFKFTGGTLTIAGSGVNTKEVTLSGDNSLNVSRRFLGVNTIAEPVEMGLRPYTGSVMAEFEDLTAYNRFVNHTEAALVLTFSANSSSIAITTNVRFDGETPEISGRDVVEQPLPFTCIASGADSTAISIVVTEA